MSYETDIETHLLPTGVEVTVKIERRWSDDEWDTGEVVVCYPDGTEHVFYAPSWSPYTMSDVFDALTRKGAEPARPSWALERVCAAQAALVQAEQRRAEALATLQAYPPVPTGDVSAEFARGLQSVAWGYVMACSTVGRHEADLQARRREYFAAGGSEVELLLTPGGA
jgi:hypothetical protein